MIFYLAKSKGFRVEILPLLETHVRVFKSPLEAASGLWESGEAVSDRYDLFELDLDVLTVRKVDIPEIRFE